MEYGPRFFTKGGICGLPVSWCWGPEFLWGPAAAGDAETSAIAAAAATIITLRI
jgi:hypothetical protein